MTETSKTTKIILIVGSLPGSSRRSLLELKNDLGDKLRLVLIHDKSDKRPNPDKDEDTFDFIIKTDFNSPEKVQEALLPHKKSIKAITCFSESKIPYFRKIIPNIPYLLTPTAKSLEWATNKIKMRRRLRTHNPKLAPRFKLVKNADANTLKNIEKTLDFPVVVKPSGLAASALVTIAYHEEELKKALKKVFRKINKLYRDTGRSDEPQVLVEEFMEGRMYSVDGYVNNSGETFFLPPVYIKTGKEIGFDDFFGYIQLTPTRLKQESIESLNYACSEAVEALALKNTTLHIELFRTEDGWKIIELGPRIGGFRNTMYKLSFGINHALNDIRNRMGKKPKIPRKVKGYTAAMKFYAPQEGRLQSIRGVRKMKKLTSYVADRVKLDHGERARYAKNGGKGVFDIMLHNEKRSKLLADIRRLEKMVKITVE